MPTISAFFGIVVRMYYDDHAPPHFHAYYGGYAAQIHIETLVVLDGWLPKRVLALVVEWALEHQPELRDDVDAQGKRLVIYEPVLTSTMTRVQKARYRPWEFGSPAFCEPIPNKLSRALRDHFGQLD